MIINSEYEIKGIDDKNIALIKLGVAEKGKNAGQRTERIIGYYSSISDALKSMIKKEIIGDGLKDLERINNKIELLYEHIDKALSNIK